ncbi:peroxisomal membrane protein PEX16 [Nilaparvata lugens]|uniref:peroxisomal membrane protein PEX16 n=1 Tax=Nilaparvata lugens TaxID=108931 RepID=UPI00193D0BBF|nr:peroxisomal membrane protein PEX16 [Nilaparvata lugens]
MALVVRSIEDVFKSYKEWVCKNPQRISDIETAVKWISYALAGKVSDSAILSELVYCISNLWALVNDQIILNDKLRRRPDAGNSIKTWLTVLEYSEVFVELSARQVYGEKGRWILIATIQAFKCVLRLLLVVQYKETVLPTPPLEPLKRQDFVDDDNQCSQPTNNAFALRSGRTIRTVTSAQDMSMRTWKPPAASSVKSSAAGRSGACNGEARELILNEAQKVGETLFILKPLLHLGSMYVHGTKSWAPWTYSFLLDLISLALLDDSKNNGNLQQSAHAHIIAQRKLSMIRYLFRSPFYDAITRRRLERTLTAVAETVPLTRLVAEPLIRYLPHWQETYYYLWSS